MSIKKVLSAAFFVAASICLMAPQSAQANGCKLINQTGCSCCPVCDHVCNLDAEQVEEEKTCFEVESKAICIPRVVFPWQRSKKASCASCDSCDGQGCTACVHNGARVRKVCVLKTKKYKCPACKYTWTAEKKDSCGCCNGGPSCDGGCICDAGCDGSCDSGYSIPSAPTIAPAPAAPTAPTAPTAPAVPVPVAEPVADTFDYYYRRPADASPSTASLPYTIK